MNFPQDTGGVVSVLVSTLISYRFYGNCQRHPASLIKSLLVEARFCLKGYTISDVVSSRNRPERAEAVRKWPTRWMGQWYLTSASRVVGFKVFSPPNGCHCWCQIRGVCRESWFYYSCCKWFDVIHVFALNGVCVCVCARMIACVRAIRSYLQLVC